METQGKPNHIREYCQIIFKGGWLLMDNKNGLIRLRMSPFHCLPPASVRSVLPGRFYLTRASVINSWSNSPVLLEASDFLP